MELRDIQSFIEVANHQSFTKAAEHSYLSQPSLSKAVKKLEEEFHMELLERSTRHIQLTDAGKVVYEQGKKLMNILEETKMLLDELANVAIGEIKIGIPPLIGTLFFPSIAGNFHQQYPNVKLELVEVGARVVEQLVEEGEIDVGIVVLPVDESIFHISSFLRMNLSFLSTRIILWPANKGCPSKNWRRKALYYLQKTLRCMNLLLTPAKILVLPRISPMKVPNGI